jgi:hypothetical protein
MLWLKELMLIVVVCVSAAALAIWMVNLFN